MKGKAMVGRTDKLGGRGASPETQPLAELPGEEGFTGGGGRRMRTRGLDPTGTGGKPRTEFRSCGLRSEAGHLPLVLGPPTSTSPQHCSWPLCGSFCCHTGTGKGPSWAKDHHRNTSFPLSLSQQDART